MKDLTKKNVTVEVSIGNATKALTELRTYGLTEKEAESVIIEETHVAVNDHGIIPDEAISPGLIEMFGIQHINDALAYTYLYMDDFDVSWDIMKMSLNSLLEVYRPEELILNPEIIRTFLESLEEAYNVRFFEEEISDSCLYSTILSELDSEDIKNWSEPAEGCEFSEDEDDE